MNAALADDPQIKPASVIATIQSYNGPVLVDFDETLYLRNSTEDFIDSARPALLALIAMRLLDAIKPWRWTGGDATRDVWRVRCIAALFPWTKKRWERRAQSLASSLTNGPLAASLLRRSLSQNLQPAIVTTIGFDFIVAPLLAAMGLSRLKLVAARLSTFADRRDGKYRMVTARIGNEIVRRALVLTDSKQDTPLLDACALPILMEWPQAHYRPALSARYLPGQYLTLVKRPGEQYISRGILQEDFALWVLTSIGLAAEPIAHVIGLAFLLLSFWSIYEAGYVDNDKVAVRFEHEPKLSSTYGRAVVATPSVEPWIWAIGSGAIGVLALRGPTQAAAFGFAAWLGVLVATYFGFALYNRLDKGTRIWWYCPLQLARSAAFVALVPIALIGAMAIGAHVIAKWVPYYIYRVGGKAWPDSSHFLTRLLIFVLLAVLVAMTGGFASLWSGTALALLAWNVYRARHELVETCFDATRIDKQRDSLERKRSA